MNHIARHKSSLILEQGTNPGKREESRDKYLYEILSKKQEKNF
jgi:hypothetical protein